MAQLGFIPSGERSPVTLTGEVGSLEAALTRIKAEVRNLNGVGRAEDPELLDYIADYYKYYYNYGLPGDRYWEYHCHYGVPIELASYIRCRIL